MSAQCDSQLVPSPNDTITFNVGGQLFTTRRSTLYRLPNSRLFNTLQQKTCDAIFFDRDPEIFRYVLDYYRTGELHLPHTSCAPFVRKEIIFWGVPEEEIEACCLNFYMKYDEERQTKNALFKDCFEDIEPMQNLVRMSTGMRRLRYKTWLFLDYPTSSIIAKVWAFILLVLVAVSIAVYSLATHMNFRVAIQNLTDVSLLNASNGSTIFSECAGQIGSESAATNKHYRYRCTFPTLSIVLVDLALNGIFTLELVFKTMLAPDRKKFLRSGIVLLEVIISTSFWLQIILRYYTSPFTSIDVYNQQLALRSYMTITDDEDDPIVMLLLVCCRMLQALRVFRVFKLSKISSGLRVLMLTVKTSITELLLLAFLLINGMFLFACLIYLAEYQVADTFVDIPHALWWAIITITSVGYGDMYPKAGPGFVVGALCAISGCMVTGLAIPIIANNFNTYYKYMKNYLKESRYLKDRQISVRKMARQPDSVTPPDEPKRLKNKLTLPIKFSRTVRRREANLDEKTCGLRDEDLKNLVESNTSEVQQQQPQELELEEQEEEQIEETNHSQSSSSDDAKPTSVSLVSEEKADNPMETAEENKEKVAKRSAQITNPDYECNECNRHCMQHNTVAGERINSLSNHNSHSHQNQSNRKRVLQKLGIQAESGRELSFL